MFAIQSLAKFDKRIGAISLMLVGISVALAVKQWSIIQLHDRDRLYGLEHLVYRGHYREALRIVRQVGTFEKVDADCHDTSSLSFSLIGIGEYGIALKILKTDGNSAEGENYIPRMRQYCMNLEGEALIGMRDYAGAVKVLRSANDIAQGNPGIDFALAKAYLGLNRPDLASKHIVLLPCDSDRRCYNILSAMMKLESGDKAAAQTLESEIAKFYFELERDHDSEGIPNLEFASHYLEMKGYSSEAIKLQMLAERLKQR